MHTKEKYNTLIATIEELVKGKHTKDGLEVYSAHSISDMAFASADSACLDDRSKNVLFLFLNGTTVLDYIQNRRMNYVCKLIIDSPEWNKRLIDNAVYITGLSDDKTFAKKFKKQFGTSPKKAYDDKREDLITQPIDWEAISKDGKSSFIDLEVNEMEGTKFGINRQVFMQVSTAANLQEFYKLSDDESEFAFKLYKERGISLDDSFEYVYNYLWGSFEDANRGEELEKDLSNDNIFHMYFNCGMTFGEIVLVLIACSIQKLPRAMVNTTRDYLLGFREYVKACRLYKTNLNGEIPDYEEIFSYYQKNKLKSDDTEVLKIFAGSIPYLREKDKELSDARISRHEMYMSPFENYHSEFYTIDKEDKQNGSELNLIDFDMDLDDPDVIENMYLSNDIQETENLPWEDEEKEWEDFNAYCDEIDMTEPKDLEVDRRLIGYKNLNINEILKILEGKE